jgi:hypothetical protein
MGLLEGFGLGEIGGVDSSPVAIVELAQSAADIHEARNLITAGMIELLEEQFANGGSTLFIDLEEISTTKASKLIPQIHELREVEIEETYLPVVQGMADLRYLWMTYYGFSILSTMKVKDVRMNLRMLRSIQNAMERIDVTLRLEDGPDKPDPPKVWESSSLSLKEYVFRTVAGVERWK